MLDPLNELNLALFLFVFVIVRQLFTQFPLIIIIVEDLFTFVE